MNPLLDKKGGSSVPRKIAIASIECLQEEFDLVDIWRVKNPEIKSFTWCQNSPQIFCRLDYWFISNNLQDWIKSTDMVPALKTDHSAILLVVEDKELKHAKGQGFWKMNCAILDDTIYTQEISLLISKWVSDGQKELSDARSVWEWTKFNIRDHAIRFSKKRARSRKDKEAQLEKEYASAKQIYEIDSCENNLNMLITAREKIESFYEEKTRGIIIRARARWHEYGEKSSKYFLNLEKRNHVEKHMRKLHINNSFTTDPTVILAEQKRFYQDLYTSGNKCLNNDAIETFLMNLNIPKLTDEQKDLCEGKIYRKECKRVLDSFQDNKTPGSDGIPIEFYKRFWHLIEEPFISCVNECFEKGELACSQKQAVITLIEKKGKDRLFLENWRPISLLNVDVKIMSKVIATKIKNVLPTIVHHNQTGFINDRYIGETVRSIFDLMDFTLSKNIPGLLIFIDFHKAFDCLEWNFLFSCLKVFNFGPDFIRWVEIFYKNIQSCVINNGFASDFFALERGVRQGDPLSPYLFVLAVEVLAIAVRQNTSIRGISIDGQETKLLQYADDTTATLADFSSARAFFDLLDTFKLLSGLAINYSKTEGMWIGSCRNNNSKPFGIKWPREPIKALGVYYSYDLTLLREKNFIENLDKIKKLLNLWSCRGLSLYGKVTVIKTLVIPKFVYICSLLPVADEFVKELNRLVYKFLWNGPDKTIRLSTINDYAKGGLRMIDLDCMIKSLRLAWLQRIYNVTEGPWKWYLSHLLTKFGGLFLFNCNYDVNDLSVPSPFYFQLLKWWSEFREDFASVKDWQNIIWNNRDIRIDGSPVFYKNFFLSGIVYLRDLLLNCNNIDSFEIAARNIEKSNFLIWTGLRDSIPFHLKDNTTRTLPSSNIPSFSTGNGGEVFCVNTKKSRDYYLLLISKKAKLPNAIAVLHRDFNLSEKQLQQAFLLPHKIALEPYVRAFQYKVLNRILYTNDKLYKIGFISHKDCTFCKSEVETLTHLLYHCPFSIAFWRDFEAYWSVVRDEQIHLTLEDIVVGLLTRPCPLLNYFLLIAKIYLWDCRRNQSFPNIVGFKAKIELKYETEAYIARKGNKIKFLQSKWANCTL